jgi:hypothetical protein
MGITENHLPTNQQSGYGLLDQILSPSNLNAAYKRVVRHAKENVNTHVTWHRQVK